MTGYKYERRTDKNCHKKIVNSTMPVLRAMVLFPVSVTDIYFKDPQKI